MPLLRRAPPLTHNKVLFQQKGNIGLAAYVPTSSAGSRCEALKQAMNAAQCLLIFRSIFLVHNSNPEKKKTSYEVKNAISGIKVQNN